MEFSGVFPDDWKNGSITPLHKKYSKQIVGNYRPVLSSSLKLFNRF